MKLLIIVLALLALRYIHIGRSERRYAWLVDTVGRWLQWLQARGIQNISFLILLVVSPFLLFIYGIEAVSHLKFFSVLWVVANLFLFWFMLWPVPPEQLAVEGFTLNPGEKLHEEVLISQQGEILQANYSRDLSRNYSKKLLIEANQNTFAVIFWFIVLGIYGAVLYRVINLLYRRAELFATSSEFKILVTLLQQCIDWIPSRLVALGYVLAGDFVPGFQTWLQYAGKSIASNNDLLANTGLKAAGYDPENNQTADAEENRCLCRLMDRTLIVWLFLIAILVIGHWMY
jgi:membrane protein required for beta-lactamase induction